MKCSIFLTKKLNMLNRLFKSTLCFLLIYSANGQNAPAFKYAPSFSAIIVKDVDTSAAWYQAVFDMKTKNRINDTERGFRIVIMEHSSFILELIENKSWPDQKQLLSGKPEGTRIQGFFKIGFSVAHIDNCLKHLASLKIVPDRVYTDSETKKRNFLIEDPDKNLIQFFE